MAHITELSSSSPIELSTLRPPSPAPSAGAAGRTPSIGSSTQVDSVSIVLTRNDAVPAYFQSSDKTSSGFVQAPVLLVKNGQTVSRSEASGQSHVPNKMLEDALAIYMASADPRAQGENWHGIVDPISMTAPELAVQVVSPYCHTVDATGAVSEYTEHQVFEMQSIVDWCKTKAISPVTRGALILPLRITPNIAVANLIRDSQDTQKPPLSAGQQIALVTYCDEVSAYLNAQLAPVSKFTSSYHSRTKTANAAAALTLGAGAASVVGLHFLKGVFKTPQAPPKPPRGNNVYTHHLPFFYSCRPSHTGIEWDLNGCDASAQACDAISIWTCEYDTDGTFNGGDSRSSKPPLIGAALFDLCMTQQASCAADAIAYTAKLDAWKMQVRTYEAQLTRMSIGKGVMDGAAVVGVIAALAVARFFWVRGKKVIPVLQMPTLALASEDV